MRNYKDFEGDDGFVSPADIDEGYEPGMSDAERGERQMKQSGYTPKFDFSKPVDENLMQRSKSERAYESISVDDAKHMSDAELSDAALRYQEEREDAMDELVESNPQQKSSYVESESERPVHSYRGLNYSDPVAGMSESEISDMMLEEQEAREDAAYERYLANKEVAKAMNEGSNVGSKQMETEDYLPK